METHQFLIGAYYVYVAIATIIIMIRGERTPGPAGIAIGFLIFAGLTSSIFATGDPSSWQAVFLMVWWAGNALYSVTQIGKTTYFDEPWPFLVFGYIVAMVLTVIPMFLIGVNIPAGG